MSKPRVGIMISGGGSNMVALVNSMTGDHPARPVLVLSNEPGAGGLQRARDLGIATEVVNHRDFPDRASFEDEIHARLQAHDVDILCLAGFMRILTAGFTDRWRGRCLNIHPSILPDFRGLHTHQRALDAGAARHGCTVHEVTSELDDGPILGQAFVPVLPVDTAETLAARVLTQEHRLYPAVLRRFAAGDRRPILLDGPQDRHTSNLAPDRLESPFRDG